MGERPTPLLRAWTLVVLALPLARCWCFQPVGSEHEPPPPLDGGGDASTSFDAGEVHDGGGDGGSNLPPGDGGCVPFTCSGLQVSCGAIPNGCGELLSCGQCVAPPPECIAAQVLRTFTSACNYGQCTSAPTDTGCEFGCNADAGACNPCMPQSCEAGACGTVSNGCGGQIQCGPCAFPQTCGGGGAVSQCGTRAWQVAAQLDGGTFTPVLNGSSDFDVWVGLGAQLLHGSIGNWVVLSPPAYISSVTAFSPGAAIGSGSTAYHSFTMEYVWDGQYWNPGGAYDQGGIGHIWAPDSDAAWLVSTNGIIQGCPNIHNGQVCNLYNNPGTQYSWNWVWGTSNNDIWTVGQRDAWHFDGNSWTPNAPPTSTNDNLVQVTISGDDVWMASSAGSVFHYRYSTGARDALSLAPSTGLAGIWANSTTDVWAVGGPSVFHWDGAQWERDSRLVGVSFQAVWGPAQDSIWVLDQQVLYHLGP